MKRKPTKTAIRLVRKLSVSLRDYADLIEEVLGKLEVLNKANGIMVRLLLKDELKRLLTNDSIASLVKVYKVAGIELRQASKSTRRARKLAAASADAGEAMVMSAVRMSRR